MFVIFAVTLTIYIDAEKKIDRVNEARYRSYVLADVLRQSSDDLTRMVRTYVATGDVIYKKHYQEILAIRDGKSPRPIQYEDIYWDLVLPDDQRPRPVGQAVALMDLMRQAGFTDAEFAKLTQAKANSDTLTKTEFAAMALIESTTPTTESNRIKATRMLNDAAYHQAKSNIMRPISEFYQMVDRRTLEAVHDAEHAATMVRVILIALGLLLAFVLWNAYRALQITLGCSVDELQGRIARLGSGDVSTPIPIPAGMEDSVLAWLSETQINLARLDAESKQAEAEVRRLNAELERRVVQRTDELETAIYDLENFTYSASHDLRIPLRAIDGFAKLLLAEHAQQLDEEGMRLLNIVRDGARKMSQYIDDMTAFTRSGRATMKLEEVDLEQLVGEVMAETKPDDMEIELVLHKLPHPVADRSMLHQALFCVLSNSVKFCRPKAAPQIEVGARIEQQEIVYYVKDNGVGFDMRFVDKLFGVFQRLHSVTEFEGNGIGLAVFKRIITRHGGRVWAEGKVGEGATIYFALPIKEATHG
ncbi:MAG: two-component sensor histidine kinase [Gammaproteobacteria bacterium]|nr:two-component sensor histidine kinase [Gammaproteobacteria bacterium]MBU1447076.1 two-component sensor histidine kinase [Gammaproteobacteria bacterium]